MNGKCFVDTNILVYAHDRTSGEKHSGAKALVEQLWELGNGAISTQVLQELCVNLRRKARRPLAMPELRRLVREYSTWEVVVNGPDAILKALEIEERHKISFWDALIIQSAEEAGASILYSEDLAAGQLYGPVKVVNPFAQSGGSSIARPPQSSFTASTPASAGPAAPPACSPSRRSRPARA